MVAIFTLRQIKTIFHGFDETVDVLVANLQRSCGLKVRIPEPNKYPITVIASSQKVTCSTQNCTDVEDYAAYSFYEGRSAF